MSWIVALVIGAALLAIVVLASVGTAGAAVTDSTTTRRGYGRMSSPNAGNEADYIEQKMPVEPEEPLEPRTREESLADEVPTADALEQAQDAQPSDDETQWPREA